MFLQIALRAVVGSIAHDDSLVAEVREAFEELEHGRAAGSFKNSILLQVLLLHVVLVTIQCHCDVSGVMSVATAGTISLCAACHVACQSPCLLV